MAIAPEQIGIGIRRYFTQAGEHPYDTIEWEQRDARIQNFKDGTDAFYQPDVEFPVSWSQNATNIVAQKYFRGTLGTDEREQSLREVIDRVADTITAWGVRDGYFVDDREGAAFRNELKYILVHQRGPSTARSGSTSASRTRRSKRPRASSSRSRTRWTGSSTGTARRGPSSRAARAPASTSRTSARRRRVSPAAAPRAAR